MADSKLHKEKGKTRRGIYGDDVPTIVNQYFDRKCGKIDGKLSRNEKREKELRKDICNRWAALGLTEELQGVVNEKIRKLFESEAQELLNDSDKEPQFPRIVEMPPHTFNLPEKNKE